MVLLALAVPLNYFLVKEFGIVGAGYSNLVSLSVYNIIRIIFLKRKFNMHPFSNKTIYAVLLALGCYIICYFTFLPFHGFFGILLKSSVFVALYGGAIIYFDLSPDVLPIWDNIKDRARLKRKVS
jgi:O-antigen/teichoic acid export membrane protein